MKDELCAYYTESDDITSYMIRKLGVCEKDLVLEPSAGEGVFIDAVLRQNPDIKVDALDIDEKAISVLREKYSENPNVSVRQTDTLLDGQLDLFGSSGGHYDKVIGNPPYGAWQNRDKRSRLKEKYAGHYVKETYTLFLLRSISVLKMGGRLSFIVPDTFLFLHMHEKLRKVLLTSAKIEEILIFPSHFFPGVSFGYSNLSIITLEKCTREEALGNTVRIIKGFGSSREFERLSGNDYQHLNLYELDQDHIFSSDKSRFLLPEDDVAAKIGKTSQKLGDVADIVTGFYSGDNKRFIRVRSKSVKGSKDYPEVEADRICECMSLDGIAGVEEGYVPYVKGSSPYRYKRMQDEWYVRWDKPTIGYYKENKKARFQNAQFYFKTGIALPMVKAGEIRATLMEKRVFDQSVVGIFPKDEGNLYYVLALLNSDVMNKLVHMLNPTANNSSNYIKQLPYVEPAKADKDRIDEMVKEIMRLDPEKDREMVGKLHEAIDKQIKKIYG